MSKKNVVMELKFDFDKLVKENFSEEELAKSVEYTINQKILRLIDKGLSPVRGFRSFAKYKNPARYPGDQKESNKANLTLTGQMLSHYEARPLKSGERVGVTMGIHKDAPEGVRIKADSHNNGTSLGIPRRPFIPRKGEEYVREVMIELRKNFALALAKALSKRFNK